MHKLFKAQKSYCTCCVLSLATIRSKYYFNFILNRTRSGRELFDRPSYNALLCCSHFGWKFEDFVSGSIDLSNGTLLRRHHKLVDSCDWHTVQFLSEIINVRDDVFSLDFSDGFTL